MKLKTCRIIDEQSRLKPRDVLELRKYVSHVECSPGVDITDSDDVDEEF